MVPCSFGQSLTPGMLGPYNGATVDINGLLTATPDGPCAVPSRSGTNLTLYTPWSVDPVNGYLCGFDSVTGKYTAICRTTPGGLFQMIAITGYSAFRHAPGKVSTYAVGGSFPSTFTYTQSGVGPPKSGTGQLVDQNSDGVFDGMTLAGPGLNVTLPFVYVDINGDGFADYISIPWSQATLVGVNPNSSVLTPGAGGPNPQVWIPLADTNGDGKPDSIMLDLDGNGVPDPDVFASPALGPVSAPAALSPLIPVPAFSEWGILAVILALTTVGLWQVKVHSQV